MHPPNPSHVGKVSVIDGDTLRMGETRIRLNGLHAPERGEPGFEEATVFMKEITAGELVRCEQVETDRYGRVIAICYVDGRDVAAALVTAGLGRDCQRYSGGRYETLEQQKTREGMPLPSYCYR